MRMFEKKKESRNKGMQQELRIEKGGQKASENKVVVLVTFRKGSSIRCRFTFELNGKDESDTEG